MLRDAHKIYLLCTSIHVFQQAARQAFVLSLRLPFLSSFLFPVSLISVMSAGLLLIGVLRLASAFIIFLAVVAFGFIPLVSVSFQHCPFRALLKRKSPT